MPERGGAVAGLDGGRILILGGRSVREDDVFSACSLNRKRNYKVQLKY